jgi:hypothetical protein
MAIKTITADYGEGRKTYKYDDKLVKRLQDKHFLGEDDAIEIAINRYLAKERRRKEKNGN